MPILLLRLLLKIINEKYPKIPIMFLMDGNPHGLYFLCMKSVTKIAIEYTIIFII